MEHKQPGVPIFWSWEPGDLVFFFRLVKRGILRNPSERKHWGYVWIGKPLCHYPRNKHRMIFVASGEYPKTS